ncbi:MAG: hypothetical protein IT355_00825 [Gemmatimonadaceae bacterium]|nr:hypothetical protein [Gemmatimonadaceae bacterium]
MGEGTNMAKTRREMRAQQILRDTDGPPKSGTAVSSPKKAADFYKSGPTVKVGMFLVQVAAFALLVMTVWLLWKIIGGAAFNESGTWTLVMPKREGHALLWCWVIWVMVPPAWFAFEYFFLYDREKGRSHFEEFKYGQEVVAKAWATLVVVVGGVLYKSLT